MTIRRPLLGTLCAVLIAASGVRPALADEPGAAAAVSDADRARVLAQIDAVGRRGFLYEVTREATHEVAPNATPDRSNAKRLFLYGTIHVGRVGSEPFNGPVLRALRASRRLALEADPSDTAATAQLALQLGRYAAGDGLPQHVTADVLARVTDFGLRNGMPPGSVERFRPWLLANMVTARQTGDSGLDADLGSELYLAGFARGAAMPIVEVEGLEAQLRMLAATPDAVQNAALDEALSDAAGGAAADDSRALFDLWLAGDADAAERLIDEMHRDARQKVFERYFVDTLIDARNTRMADAAERDFEQPGVTFFAVGALHLFGEHGLIREFERRGYRVTDLQAPLAVR